jgi:ABC-type phosphate transport system substrate-binding protein
MLFVPSRRLVGIPACFAGSLAASFAASLALLGGLALSGCSQLLDRSEQCRADSDCVEFGNHPYCREGVCVESHLGPKGCFFGAPRSQPEFAAACSTAQCLPFDNCGRLGLCQSGTLPDELVPPENLGTAPPLVNVPPAPTIMCADPARRNIIYATGSTNLLPLLQGVAPLLAANDPPYTVVFQAQSSCKGAASMFDPDLRKHVIRDIPNNWAFFFDAGGNKNYCLLKPEGNAVDVGESDIYASTCGYEATPGIADYPGPIQAITFVVPAGSSQRSISAEAAHYLFGAGGKQGTISPWVDPRLYFVRSSGTGTVQLVSRAINVPATAWWGIDRLSADNLRDSLEGIDPTVAEQAIGVLSSDFADRARANLNVLAFQAAGQSCGYLPDSTPVSYDKENVRDGHYPIWGPIHLYAATTNGVPSAAADALVRRFSVPRLEQTLLDAIVGAGYIPSCAMRVRRDQEMGPVVAWKPQFGCGCYYESKVNNHSTCAVCGGPGDCPASRPACNYGFCEEQ